MKNETIDQPIRIDDYVIDGLSNQFDRIRHFVVDFSVIGFFSVIAYHLVYKRYFANLEKLNAIVGVSIFLTLYFIYYFLFELKTSRTPGKMINKTIIVSERMGKISWKQVLLRTILRIPFSLIYIISLQSSLHDVMSKTRVIRVKKEF